MFLSEASSFFCQLHFLNCRWCVTYITNSNSLNEPSVIIPAFCEKEGEILPHATTHTTELLFVTNYLVAKLLSLGKAHFKKKIYQVKLIACSGGRKSHGFLIKLGLPSSFWQWSPAFSSSVIEENTASENVISVNLNYSWGKANSEFLQLKSHEKL